MTDRFPFPRSELRHRTLRGVVITGGFVRGFDVRYLRSPGDDSKSISDL